jgi:hypothetical protein
MIECVKRINPNKLWQPILPFFKLFTLKDKNDTNSNELLKSIEAAYDNGGQFLWYPSSGNDVTDMEFVNQENIDLDTEPTIFIHTDALMNGWAFDQGLNNISNGNIEFLGKQIQLYEFANDISTKYLITISIRNEDFFKEVIGKIEMTFLYNFCDGITSGMGLGDNKSITSLFYTQFYKSLGVKYHFTEYHTEHIMRYNDFQLQIANYLQDNPDLHTDENFPGCIQNKQAIPINHKNGYLRFCDEIE